MGQCKAIWYKRPGISPGLYCIREAGHQGDHATFEGEKFTDAQAKYHKPNRLPKDPKK